TMAFSSRWSVRTLVEGEGPGGAAARASEAGSGVGGLVGSRLLMRHLPGGGREQPPAQHAAEQAEELLTRRVRQPVPEWFGANRASFPRRRRGGTDRLEGSDMARLPGASLGVAGTSVPAPTAPTH